MFYQRVPPNMGEALRIIALSDQLQICQKRLAADTGRMIAYTDMLLEQMAVLALRAASHRIWRDGDLADAETKVTARAREAGWKEAFAELARAPSAFGRVKGSGLGRAGKEVPAAAVEPLRSYLELTAHMMAVEHFGQSAKAQLQVLEPLAVELQIAVSKDREAIDQELKMLVGSPEQLPRVQPNELTQ